MHFVISYMSLKVFSKVANVYRLQNGVPAKSCDRVHPSYGKAQLLAGLADQGYVAIDPKQAVAVGNYC